MARAMYMPNSCVFPLQCYDVLCCSVHMTTWKRQFFVARSLFVLSTHHTTIWFNYVQQNYAKCISTLYTKHQTKKISKLTLFGMEHVNYIDGIESKRVYNISCTRPNTYTHTQAYFDYRQACIAIEIRYVFGIGNIPRESRALIFNRNGMRN